MVVFTGPPLTPQCLWPEHCVGGTSGAELHPDLKVRPNKGIAYMFVVRVAENSAYVTRHLGFLIEPYIMITLGLATVNVVRF